MNTLILMEMQKRQKTLSLSPSFTVFIQLTKYCIALRCSFKEKTCTCVLQHKSIAAERGVAAESQEERVGAALNAIGNICAIKATQQGAEGVRSIIDVQEVITWLQAEPGYRE